MAGSFNHLGGKNGELRGNRQSEGGGCQKASEFSHGQDPLRPSAVQFFCEKSLFDHLIGQQRSRDGEAERLGGLKVDHQLELGRLKHGQVAGLFALENSAGVTSQ
jgi:hypothetical protein